MQLTKVETQTLPDGNSDLPIVLLADVEQNPMLVRDEDYMSDGIDWANRYTYNWSPFAPMQYDSNERGIIANMMWQDGSGTYSPSISSNIYELSVPALAERVTLDLIKWHSYGDGSEQFVEREHPDFDLLIVQEDAEMKRLFASKGKAVMHVRYHGYADVDAIIEQVAEKIALISGE